MRIVSKVFLLFCILSLMSCQKDPQIQAAYDLIERITPGYSQQFRSGTDRAGDGERCL